MEKNWFRKSLVVGIILLLFCVSVLSSISSANDKDVVNESNENPEIEPFDDYNEILSFLDGGQVSIKFKGRGLIRHVEIWTDSGRWVDIEGYKYPTNDDPEYYFSTTATHVIAPMFIGFSYPTSPDYDYVRGIALGNIEWS